MYICTNCAAEKNLLLPSLLLVLCTVINGNSNSNSNRVTAMLLLLPLVAAVA